MTLIERAPLPASVSGPCCGDHGTTDGDVQRLRDLMGSGLSQLEASAIVWGGCPDVPAAATDVVGWVRRMLRARLPWLEDGAGNALIFVAGWLVLFAATCAWAVWAR